MTVNTTAPRGHRAATSALEMVHIGNLIKKQHSRLNIQFIMMDTPDNWFFMKIVLFQVRTAVCSSLLPSINHCPVLSGGSSDE